MEIFDAGVIFKECGVGDYSKWQEKHYGFLNEIKINYDKEKEKVDIKYVLNIGGDFYNENGKYTVLEECTSFSKLLEIPKYKGLENKK